jgi:hypothetical protein
MIDAAGNYACGDQASIINHVLERNNGQSPSDHAICRVYTFVYTQVYSRSARSRPDLLSNTILLLLDFWPVRAAR